MLTALRIEHPETGHGPFSKSNPERDALSAHTLALGLPEIYGDCPTFDCGAMICGVQTPDLLKEWFGPFFEILHRAGFIITVYLVKPGHLHSAKSAKQVAFRREDAEVGGAYSLENLWKDLT